MPPRPPLNFFVAYDQADANLQKELLNHLALLTLSITPHCLMLYCKDAFHPSSLPHTMSKWRFPRRIGHDYERQCNTHSAIL